MSSADARIKHDRVDGQAGCNEQTPLLANENHAPTADPDIAESSRHDHDPTSVPDKDKPLPVRQMLLLCFARIVEPVAFFSIFPFINQMIERNGKLAPADVGFYSGLIESMFSLTQMLVMIIWGRMSDRYGRKPILCLSLIGIAFSTALFGFAQTVWQMILFRSLAGVFAGTIVTIRTMISEHSTPKTQARAFSWFAFTGNLGIFVGPLLGGALADPANQYRRAFGGIKFFEHFPYALPTLVTGSISLISGVLSILFVEETLPIRFQKRTKVNGAEGGDSSVNGQSHNSKAEYSTWDLINSPGVLPILYLYGHIMILAYAYTAVTPVFWYEPVKLGGFGFSSAMISIFMGVTGASQAIWLLLVFPPLQHRFGTGGVLRACAVVYPVFLTCPPLLNLLLRQGSQEARISFWVLAPMLLSLGSGVSMSFTAIQLALNDVSPTPQTLGTLNALALTFVSGLRAACPTGFTSIFAIGVKNQILWGYLAWAVMVAWAAGLILAMRWLPARAEGKIIEEDQND